MDTRIWARTSIVVAIITAALAVMGVPAAAAPPDDITEYLLPTADGHPYGIAAGPDGNLWFTSQNAIGRITPTGAITEYRLPTAASFLIQGGIAAGPDGNMWFTEPAVRAIGRITPTGVITEYPLPTPNTMPRSIVAGPDGNMWFTETWGPGIGRITPDGTITEFPVLTGHTYPGPWGIAAGSDDNLWFTEYEDGGVGRITPTGTVTEYAPGAVTAGIAAGPDGNMWITDYDGMLIYRMTTAGTVTTFRVPTGGDGSAGEITAGPDGNMWFTEPLGNRVGRITPTGAIVEYPLPTADSRPSGIAAGPDGNLWFTESAGNKIGRISPKATPMVVKRPCPVRVTPHMPSPTKIGSSIFTDRITTKKSSCVLRRPVVRVQLQGSSNTKNPVFDTKITKRGKVRVTTKGHDGLFVTVMVRAYPKRGFADRWKRGTWRKMWYLG